MACTPPLIAHIYVETYYFGEPQSIIVQGRLGHLTKVVLSPDTLYCWAYSLCNNMHMSWKSHELQEVFISPYIQSIVHINGNRGLQMLTLMMQPRFGSALSSL